MKVIVGLFGAYVVYRSFVFNGFVLSEDWITLAIGFACIWYAFNGGSGEKKKHTSTRRVPLGTSCYDCKYCDSKRNKDDMIYCKWDDTYYYPETGSSCSDRNK